MNIPTPYLVFLGDAKDFKQAKTAFGISEWRPDLCVGQQKLPECEVDLGLTDMTSGEAYAAGAKTFLIGISPFTTELPKNYLGAVMDAMAAGLCVANPDYAKVCGVQIYNFRHRPIKYPKGTGEKRTGLRLLTVGTDCCCGKKFTAVSISRALTKLYVLNTFRSTGQTGFLISQSGINNDTIEADFLSGAAEWLTPNNIGEHWDIVEGQGALSHPSFGAGSLSLLYGTQPDVIVMCHEPGRLLHRGVNMLLPSLKEEIDYVERVARRTNPKAKVKAISLFTKYVEDKTHIDKAIDTANELGLCVFDPGNDDINKGKFDVFVGYLANMSQLESPTMDKHGFRYV